MLQRCADSPPNCATVLAPAGALEGQQAYNKRAKVGATPGLTRQVAGFQVSAEPCVYMLDTPGIMMPAVPSDEVGLRLALAGG
jgi:ribosome biogenesis GTPase A